MQLAHAQKTIMVSGDVKNITLLPVIKFVKPLILIIAITELPCKLLTVVKNIFLIALQSVKKLMLITAVTEQQFRLLMDANNPIAIANLSAKSLILITAEIKRL